MQGCQDGNEEEIRPGQCLQGPADIAVKIPARKTGSYGIDGRDGPLRRGLAERAENHIGDRVEPAAHRNHIAVHNTGICRIDNQIGMPGSQFTGIAEQCQLGLAVSPELAEPIGIRLEVSIGKT